MDKLKWRVAERPTGPYRAFRKRGWPTAYHPVLFKGEKELDTILFMVRCQDEYTSARARGDEPHAPLILYVTDRRPKKEGRVAWEWRKFKFHFETLAAAKDFAQKYYDNNGDRLNLKDTVQ